MKLIRQAEVYAPEYLGKKDILVINDKIVAIEDQISGGFDQLTVEEIDGSSLIATPGSSSIAISISRWWRGRGLPEPNA